MGIRGPAHTSLLPSYFDLYLFISICIYDPDNFSSFGLLYFKEVEFHCVRKKAGFFLSAWESGFECPQSPLINPIKQSFQKFHSYFNNLVSFKVFKPFLYFYYHFGEKNRYWLWCRDKWWLWWCCDMIEPILICYSMKHLVDLVKWLTFQSFPSLLLKLEIC